MVQHPDIGVRALSTGVDSANVSSSDTTEHACEGVEARVARGEGVGERGVAL